MLKCILLFLLIFNVNCEKALFCPPNSQKSLWTLPSEFKCPQINKNEDIVPIELQLDIFGRALFKPKTSSYFCQCYQVDAEKTGAWNGYGNPVFSPPIPLFINSSDCEHMVQTGYSSVVQSPFVFNQEMWVTENTLEWPEYSAFAYWRYNLKSSVRNCIITNTTIIRENNTVTSNAPLSQNCTYSSQSCPANNGVVIWNVTNEAACDFHYLTTLKGHFDGKMFLSSDGTFALTFNFSGNHIHAQCDKELIISQQNYAVLKKELIFPLQRSKRLTPPHLVTSDEVAALLQGLFSKVNSMLRNSFQTLSHHYCITSTSLLRLIMAQSSSNPHKLTRFLLNDSAVTARMVTDKIMETTKCFVLDVEFAPKDQCWSKLPVVIRHMHENEEAYINPETMVLELDAEIVPCTTHAKIYISDRYNLTIYDQVTGLKTISPLPPEIQTEFTNIHDLEDDDFRVHHMDFPGTYNLFSVSYVTEMKETSMSVNKLQHILTGKSKDQKDISIGKEISNNVLSNSLFDFSNMNLSSLSQLSIYFTSFISMVNLILPLLPPQIQIVARTLLVLPRLKKFLFFVFRNLHRFSKLFKKTQQANNDDIEMNMPLNTNPSATDYDDDDDFEPDEEDEDANRRSKRSTEVFPGIKTTTTHGKNALSYTSRMHPGVVFIFNFKRHNSSTQDDTYYCSHCRKAQEQEGSGKVMGIKVVGLNFQSDPDSLAHICQGYRMNKDKADTRMLLREENQNMRTNPIPIVTAMTNITNKIAERFPDRAISMAQHLPSKASRRRDLNYHKSKSVAQDITNFFIPENLKLSCVPRDDGIINHLVRDMNETGLPYIVMMDYHLMRAFFNAIHIVVDGTFQYSPAGFLQIYTIHAVFCQLPDYTSCFVIGYALLPNKLSETYNRLFSVIRQNVEAEFGSIGYNKVFHIDHEMAAINSLERIFPECLIKSCFFHFNKNIHDYNRVNGAHGATALSDNPIFIKFKNAFVGGAHLPLNLHRQLWEQMTLLQNLPPIPEHLQGYFIDFVNYLRQFWLPKINMVNLDLDNSPRTTNPAESHHSKLNSVFQGNVNTPMSKVYIELRRLLTDSIFNYYQSQEGVVLELRRPAYRRSETRLMIAKQKLAEALANGYLPSFDELLVFSRYVQRLSTPNYDEQTIAAENMELLQIPFLDHQEFQNGGDWNDGGNEGDWNDGGMNEREDRGYENANHFDFDEEQLNLNRVAINPDNQIHYANSDSIPPNFSNAHNDMDNNTFGQHNLVDLDRQSNVNENQRHEIPTEIPINLRPTPASFQQHPNTRQQLNPGQRTQTQAPLQNVGRPYLQPSPIPAITNSPLYPNLEGLSSTQYQPRLYPNLEEVSSTQFQPQYPRSQFNSGQTFQSQTTLQNERIIPQPRHQSQPFNSNRASTPFPFTIGNHPTLYSGRIQHGAPVSQPMTSAHRRPQYPPQLRHLAQINENTLGQTNRPQLRPLLQSAGQNSSVSHSQTNRPVSTLSQPIASSGHIGRRRSNSLSSESTTRPGNRNALTARNNASRTRETNRNHPYRSRRDVDDIDM